MRNCIFLFFRSLAKSFPEICRIKKSRQRQNRSLRTPYQQFAPPSSLQSFLLYHQAKPYKSHTQTTPSYLSPSALVAFYLAAPDQPLPNARYIPPAHAKDIIILDKVNILSILLSFYNINITVCLWRGCHPWQVSGIMIDIDGFVKYNSFLSF